MAPTPSPNCLSCTSPYQSLHLLNAFPHSVKRRFPSLISVSSHPLPQTPAKQEAGGERTSTHNIVLGFGGDKSFDFGGGGMSDGKRKLHKQNPAQSRRTDLFIHFVVLRCL